MAAVQKPLWCKCQRHSWTRAQLVLAWEKGRSIFCPNVECQREITPEMLLAVLKKIGAIEHKEFEDETAPG